MEKTNKETAKNVAKINANKRRAEDILRNNNELEDIAMNNQFLEEMTEVLDK